MSRSENAVNRFREGYCCSQSVLSSFSDKLSISTDAALKMADGFGAGMGRKQQVCGAVTGSILVLGFLYGRGENEPVGKHEYTYAKVKEFMDHFEALHGSVICRELLKGCDLLIPQGQERFKAENMIEGCYGFVNDAVRLLEDIID